MEAWWKSWAELREAASGRTIVLYGRSEDWVPKTLVKLKRRPAYIVDRSAAFAGTEYLGLEVRTPDALDAEPNGSAYVVITSGSYDGIVAALEARGLRAGTDFCCCPEFRDFHRLETIRNYEQEVIVSSSDFSDKARNRYSRAGGGVYRYVFGRNAIERLAPGHYRQLAVRRDYVFAVEYVAEELHVFDRSFKLLDRHKLDRPNYCGIAYDERRDLLALVNAGSDWIAFHEPDGFRRVETVHYSRKFRETGAGQHHLNDLCIDGDRLFVSYFSHTGNWKRDVYDGGISEIDLNRLADAPVPIVRDLWMPHSPKMIEGALCYCDSMRGRLHLTDKAAAAQFQGFTRGLAYDGRFYYVGQSENMYAGRVFGLVDTLMMNAGVYLLDAETKCSRFYPMLDNMNVHDILIPATAFAA